ncbi:MAG: 2,4-dienoyl-CoA reductase [Bradyrhizobium sp.]|nr:2,4-dienoyl-CoA reductase [Bradyrhizobium sp.]
MGGSRLAVSEPLTVGSITLRNRFVMGSMHTGLEAHPEHFDQLARFYEERARGGVGLIVTGGFAPNFAGRLKDEPGTFDSEDLIEPHRKITDSVHRHDGRILLQILHAGRYGYHADIVAPSPVKSPINRDVPRELADDEIEQTISDYARSAQLAALAGYDGVEVMGSEGYLISQFLATHTNLRRDRWGGSLENRARFAIAVVKAVRSATPSGFLISYRISSLDLIDTGLSPEETIWLARQIEEAGADCLSSGIGWHEAQVPTIAGVVPHAAFAEATARIKAAVSIPVTASNRINLPEVAERIVANKGADLVSMARPFLADPSFVNKLVDGRADNINVCIACNQACLDHYFTNKVITCVVNARAAREMDFTDASAPLARRVAVVGAGVAGLACALEAARRGHRVTILESGPEIGGQLRLASRVPGKADYARAIEGFQNQLRALGVEIRLGRPISAEQIVAENFDDVVIATGIQARALDIPGADDPRVVGYTEILGRSVVAGSKVVIIGAGGIGHDIALFLAHPSNHDETDIGQFERRWGIIGGATPEAGERTITMLKRSPGPFGRTLGKSTGWIVRQELRDFGVSQIGGVEYVRIDDEGLVIRSDGRERVIEADTIVVCAGQESNRELADALELANQNVHIIGGAKLAGELDAQRAIDEGARLGNRL